MTDLSNISIIFETVPPNKGTPREKVEARVKEVIAVKDYVDGYIIPDLTKEDIPTLRKPKMGGLDYATYFYRLASDKAIFLNKITVFTPVDQLLAWILHAYNFVDYVTLVGQPRHSTNEKLGPSVSEVGKILREHELPYGCILIPTRKKEVERVSEKSPNYMVTQIQLSSDRLIEFMKHYHEKVDKPAKVFVSLNPFSSEEELQDLKQLGVEVPNYVRHYPPKRASITLATQVAEKVYEEALRLGIPTGFNVGHIRKETLELSIDLATQLYEKFKSGSARN